MTAAILATLLAVPPVALLALITFRKLTTVPGRHRLESPGLRSYTPAAPEDDFDTALNLFARTFDEETREVTRIR
jgi:hypothetical protein